MTAGLDAGGLLAAATAETGLTDYADPTLPERFAVAVDHLNAIGMDTDGVAAAAQVCRWLLTSRLEFVEDRNRYPIANEVIDGTDVRYRRTPFGHNTDACADVRRSRRPRAAVLGGDVSVAAARPGRSGRLAARARPTTDWREINAKMPKWLHSHPYNDMLGDGLPEDERTWAFDFRVMTPTAWWRVPMQSLVGGLATDATAQYRLHKAMLQQLQYRAPIESTGCLKVSTDSG